MNKSFLTASHTCLIYQTKEQAIDIIRIWYIFEHRASPSTIQKCCFIYFKFCNCNLFFEQIFPHPSPSKFNFSFSPLIKVLVAPLTIIVKIYTCSTIQLYSLHHLNNQLHCVHTLCTAETNVIIFF